LRVAVLAAAVMLAIPAARADAVEHSAAGQAAHSGGAPAAQDVPGLFAEGEAALRAGDLERAAAAFNKVLAVDPGAAGAYANLGVIAMRRQQWGQALKLLQKAEGLAPGVAGIRLNIGLVYYRQNDFHGAIAPFETVVRDQPGSVQARYLLGLCYFFSERYGDAVTALDPIWPAESGDLNYLYVLGNAANKAGQAEIEERALGRFVELGQDTAEYHLLMGKAALNREEIDKAIVELQEAAGLDARLPFVHFNLGLAYLARADFEKARIFAGRGDRAGCGF
jgi:tetratricopeptide (TPR) repeat protein